MADEPDHDNPHPDTDASEPILGSDDIGGEPDTNPLDGPESSGPDDEEDDGSDEVQDDEDEFVVDEHRSRPWAARQVVSVRNAAVVGELTFHYPTRSFAVFLDGDSALRMLTIYKRRREGDLADRLDPQSSSAHAGWLVADLFDNPPMAMSWMPGLPSRPERTAMDPAPLAN